MRELDDAMIVAVLPIRVMEMALHDIVDMITVGNGFVAAIRAMPVTAIVSAALVIGCAVIGIPGRDLYAVFVDVVLMDEVQMAVMQVVDVSVVANGSVATSLLVLMVVTFVNEMILCHKSSFGVSTPVCKRNSTATAANQPAHRQMWAVHRIRHRIFFEACAGYVR